MDAYHPVVDSVRPHIAAQASDEPWTLSRGAGTRTIFWYSIPSSPRGSGWSSLDQPMKTFFFAYDPAHAGLQRLRTFRNWKDNWDGEGAPAPEKEALDTSTKVLALLVASGASPKVQLNSDGLPVFSIYGDGLDGEVVVTSKDTIEYYFHGDEPVGQSDVPFDGVKLPDELICQLASSLASA